MSNGKSTNDLNPGPVLIFCRSLKRELVRAQEEIKRIQSVPLVIGQFMEAIDQKYAYHPSKPSFLTSIALVSYNHQPVPTTSSEFSPPSIANSSNHPPPLPFTVTQMPWLTSFPRRPILPLLCLEQTRSQTSHTPM